MDFEHGVPAVLGDIRSQDVCARAVALAKPDTVFHLAAGFGAVSLFPTLLVPRATNVMGTLHLLQALTQARSPVQL